MKQGFTLIEILVGIAITVVLTLVVWSGFSSFRDSSHVSETHSAVLGMLRDARSRTLSSEKNTEYGVHFETNRIVLFLGSSYNPGSSSNEIYDFPPLARISSINLGGALDVVFSRLAGAASANGTVIIESTANNAKNKTIIILSSGSVE
ncbi:MAG: prepilin-type N-terminal cleavage/methylation domain-containing protein [Patescibacteria group bacterium]